MIPYMNINIHKSVAHSSAAVYFYKQKKGVQIMKTIIPGMWLRSHPSVAQMSCCQKTVTVVNMRV